MSQGEVVFMKSQNFEFLRAKRSAMAGIPATAPPAANSSGRVTVAWHDFRQNNCDIYLRQRSPHGGWDGERRLTWAELYDLGAADVEGCRDRWAELKQAARDEVRSGIGAAKAVEGFGSTPWDRALYLAKESGRNHVFVA